MSFVLVLTVAGHLVLADAGYQYNAPSASFGLPGNQPANFRPEHSSQQHIALPNEQDRPLTHSISYKDYVYLKQDDIHHINGNHENLNHGSNSGFAAPSNIPFIAGKSSSYGYVNAGYSQSYAPAPTANLNNNYAENYPSINNNFNSGHIQSFIPTTSGNINSGYSPSGSNSNVGYAQNAITFTGGLSTGYAQTSSASTVDLNTGYTHTSAPAVNNYFNGGNVQTVAPSTNLNSGYSYAPAPTKNTGVSHSYANAAIQSTSSNQNTGYSQTLTPLGSASLINGYLTSSASSTLNTGYSQSLAPSGIASFSSSYAQSIPSPTSANLINSYSQPISTSGLNQGYSQVSVSSTSRDLNNGYSQTLVPYSSASNTSNGYAQTSPSSASGNSNNGHSYTLVPYSSTSSIRNSYAQTSAGTGSNLNSEYSQTFPPSAGSSSSNAGYSGTSIPSSVGGINNYNTGFSHSLSSGTATTSNEFAKNVIISGGSTLNTGYTQSATFNLNTGPPQSGSFNSGFSLTGIPQTSAHLNTAYGAPDRSLNNGYAQTSATPLKINIPISTFDTSINSGRIQTSTGAVNLNIGFTQAGSNNNFNGNANTVSGDSSVTATPAVFKHIYFHVSPPEVEEQKVIPPPPPPKKNLRIIFIKVPSQESRSNLARLKQIAGMSNAAASVEHKTLIYVLVKNPETPQPVVIPNRTPSEHEVFFVKYNGNPLDLAAAVNEDLDKSGAVQSIVPLEPGLLNEKK